MLRYVESIKSVRHFVTNGGTDFLEGGKKALAKRAPQSSKPKADRPNQYWGIDITNFIIPAIGWVYLVIVVDWYKNYDNPKGMNEFSSFDEAKKTLDNWIEGDYNKLYVNSPVGL